MRNELGDDNGTVIGTNLGVSIKQSLWGSAARYTS